MADRCIGQTELPELQTRTQEVTARLQTERELERFRAIVEQTSDFVGMVGVDGFSFYVNPAGRRLVGLAPDADVTTLRMTDLMTRAGARKLVGEALPATVEHGNWVGEVEFADHAGMPIPMWQVISAHLGRDGEVEYFSTIARDLRERREAEQARQAAATAEAARAASESVTARLRTIVDGLAAIVWEADADTWALTFVSDRVEELLGYPAHQWLGDPGFWTGIIHPDDRDETIQQCVRALAEGRHDCDTYYRAIAADGRTVWLHDVVHVVRDADGRPRQLHGVMIDITAQKRREQAAALLAEWGRLLADATPGRQRLTRMLRLAVPMLADVAVVSLRGLDGRFRPVAVGSPGWPEVERTVLDLPPHRISAELLRRYQAGRAFHVATATVDEQLVPETTGGEPDISAKLSVDARSAVVVPLVVHGRPIGSLTFLTTSSTREYDAEDLALAEELGQRATLMLEAERAADRRKRLQRVLAALAQVDSAVEAARILTNEMIDGFDAIAAMVYLRQPDGRMVALHTVGFPADMRTRVSVRRPADPRPVSEATRTGRPVWIHDRAEWTRRYPGMEDQLLPETQAGVALPLRAGDQVIGVLAAGFATPRQFTADEQAVTTTLADETAQALRRAADADIQRDIANTLQHSLLPSALPTLDRVALAARYLPAARGGRAGGDWYDVLTLDQDSVAIVVGDVVGQGPTAAAVMGQLRSALAAYLLDGHGPATALQRLNRFACRVQGAQTSTAACLVLDSHTGALRWASAGHLPPLVLGPDGVRYLHDAHGIVLGIRSAPPCPESHATLTPGCTVLLYTDGLIERRGEVLDEGLARLADAADPAAAPAQLIAGILEQALDGASSTDDIALIAARLRPPPLHEHLPARPDELPAMRRAVQSWAAATGLSAELIADLQLTLGEAVTNVVEHAYAGRPSGEFSYHIAQAGDGSLRVGVHDNGTWLLPPATRRYRGRGLTIIRTIGQNVSINTTGPGTHIRFTLPPPPGTG